MITRAKLAELRKQIGPFRDCSEVLDSLEKLLAVYEAAQGVGEFLACGGPSMRPCGVCDFKEALAEVKGAE